MSMKWLCSPGQPTALDRETLRTYPLYCTNDVRPGDELAWTEGVYKEYERLGVRIIRGIVLRVEHNIRGVKPFIEVIDSRGMKPFDIGSEISYWSDKLIFYQARRKLRGGEEFLR